MFEFSGFKGNIIIISSIKMIKSCIICLALASKLVVGITLAKISYIQTEKVLYERLRDALNRNECF